MKQELPLTEKERRKILFIDGKDRKDFMSEVVRVSIARHTKNYEAMVKFYHEGLNMKIVQAWDHPDNRGTLLSFSGKAANTVIEVIQLGEEAIPGIKPINIVLSLEVDEVDAWHDELVQRGIPIRRGLEDAPWGHRGFGIDDPDGFRIWYYQDINKK